MRFGGQAGRGATGNARRRSWHARAFALAAVLASVFTCSGVCDYRITFGLSR